jgi:NADPH:quinone reductase-like Zn-dependent oxidoreductase
MKAVTYEQYGSTEVLKFQDIEKPSPGDNEVLIKMRAVSLNLSDWEIMRGRPLYSRIWGLFTPRFKILGSDLAGRVEAVGRDVHRLEVGDEVYGDAMGSFGGFAEYACAREEILEEKPSGMSFDEISTVPQAGIIAFQGLGRGEGQPGQEVLINGAGGGSGMFGIQMAKSWGAVVTGVDNSEKQKHMRAIGADHVIDYTKDDYTRTGKRYDRILDLVGTRSVFAHHRALKPGGVYRMVGGTMNSMLQTLLFGPLLGLFGAKKVGILAANANSRDLGSIVELVERGAVKVLIDKRYPLSEVAEAVRYVGEGHALGKVVITI